MIMKTIVVDLDGADNKSQYLIQGLLKAINEFSDIKIIAFSKNVDDLKEYNNERLDIIECKDEITNFDNPLLAYKNKPNSSLIEGLIKTKDSSVIGFVTLGSTGALLVGSYLILGKIAHVRPTLASTLLSKSGKPFMIIDSGSNIDCKPEMLLNFAKMGNVYMKHLNNLKSPRIALLSNGIEETKGNLLVKSTFELLKNSSLNFIGNIEAKDALMDKADIIVSDGFSGNMVLKSIEGTAKAIVEEINEFVSKNDLNLNNSIKNISSKLLEKYDYNTKGAAVLLGVNKLVIKGHGAGDSETIYNSIKLLYELDKKELIKKLKEILKLV